ncbi:uncharacterized protein LOC125201249 [Salvia hispanica]|uniref:uncharacterized protein LOC125201249 n=1 Tax=Salvia hispanica TaxID=49212 RepID=UPI002009BE8E|nr:uncharacterized protein LOC125201249 [Salvia hispanica]
MTSLIHQATIPLGDGLHAYAYIQRARIHALILLGGLIISDTTVCKVPFMWLNVFEDLKEVSTISWAMGVGKMPTLMSFFVISLMHTPYTPCGAKWHGVTEIGNAPRYSVVHYRDQLSLIHLGQFLWTPYADCILPDYCIDSTTSFLCDTYLVCWSFVEVHEADRFCR